MWTYNYTNSNELYHHGVIGMKWGVRRYQPYSTTGGRKSGESGKEVGLAKKRSSVAAKKKKFSIRKTTKSIVRAGKTVYKTGKKAYDTGEKIYKKANEKEHKKIVESGNAKKVYDNRHKLSNKELNDAIDRINKEKNLKELSKSPTRKLVDRGSSAAGDVLIESGKSLAKTYIIGVSVYNMKKRLKSKYGEDAAKEIYNPNKKK